MDPITGFTVGVDLADRASAICVVGPNGEVALRETIPTNADVIRAWFSRGRYDRVVIEACTNSSWVGWTLEECGQRVLVAYPRSIGLIHKKSRKNDRRDAEKLARLARADEHLVYPTHLRSRERTEAIADVRARAALVATRTRLVNTTRALAKMQGVRLPRCTPRGLHVMIEPLERTRPTLFATLTPLVAAIDELGVQIRATDTRLEKLCSHFPETIRMRQIHGVGEVTALTFALVIDDVYRFSRSRDVAAYLGLVPKQAQTGDTDPSMRITKAGDRYLRSLLTQCAKKILRVNAPDCDLKRWGSAIAARGGKRAKHVATVAVARRLAITLFALWKNDVDYIPIREGTMTTAA
jgi:transposase